MNITQYIPEQHRALCPALTLSPAAVQQVEALAKELELDNPENLYHPLAVSASSFRNSVYFLLNRWFTKLPLHPFHGMRLEMEDGGFTTSVFLLDWKTGAILAEHEATLPDDYPELRVIEEVRAEHFSFPAGQS
jgi:hypothetical protein